VLIAPDPPFADLQRIGPPDGSAEEKLERREWEAHLDEFARRNAGRVVSLD
jgi:hypothetical protein